MMRSICTGRASVPSPSDAAQRKDRPRNTLNTRKENGEESLLGFGHYLELGINCSGMLFVRVSSEVGRLKKDRPRKGSVSAYRRYGVSAYVLTWR
jgi:hypothetical protein